MLFEAFTEPGSGLHIRTVLLYIRTAGIAGTSTHRTACFYLFMGLFAVT